MDGECSAAGVSVHEVSGACSVLLLQRKEILLKRVCIISASLAGIDCRQPLLRKKW